ncbi:hypothetical protein ACI2IP_01890 [Microbacterium sp. NPDC090218]
MTEAAATPPRVVLVYILDLRSHRQIMERAAAQLTAFRDSGLDAGALCLDRGLPGDLPASVEGLPSRGPRLLRAFRDARTLRRTLAARSPAAVVIRYGFASGTLLRIARSFPTILEIHSDDTHELPSGVLVRTYASVSNRLYRSRLLRAVRGAMFVTRALVALPAFTEIAGPRAVIPNGTPVPADPLPVPRNSRPVVGYSVGYAAPWQGLDRLAALADALPEFTFRLVVPEPRIAEGVHDSAVEVVIADDPAAYRAAVAHFDVALGGLALDRKGIEVASALKVRESVSLGIPTLLFSRDEDLEEVDSTTVTTIARGAWTPAEVVPAVREFVRGAVGERIPAPVRQLVDIETKAQRYAALVHEVLDDVARTQPAQR